MKPPEWSSKRISRFATRAYGLIERTSTEDQYAAIIQARAIFEDEQPDIKKIEMEAHGLLHSLTGIIFDHLEKKREQIGSVLILKVIDNLENLAGYYASLENS